MKVYVILCVFFASFLRIHATPLVDYVNVTNSELHKTEQCGCSNDIQQLYAGFKEMKEEQQHVKSMLDSLTRIQSDQLPNADTRAVFPNVVGFTAALDNHVFDLPIGSTVLYDRILYNAGGHYSPDTGVFASPKAGFYLFSVFVESYSTSSIQPAEVKILVNGNTYVHALSEPTKYGQDISSGNILIQHLQRGDRVWVETYETDNQDLSHAFNSFSGVLIQSTE